MPTKSATTTPSPERSRSSILLPVLLAVAVIGLIISYWGYAQTKKKLSVLTNPSQANELNAAQTEELLAKVGKLITLPDEKNPVVATINDVESLSARQDFYAQANNGDKLIVFARSRKAVIYDEKDNLIVNMGPVFYTDKDGKNQPPSQVEDGRITIDLRNGSKTKDMGITTRDKLEANAAFHIIRLAKAANGNYTGNVIFNNIKGGAKADLVASLAKELNATVVTKLPDGEADSAAEIVVVLGS